MPEDLRKWSGVNLDNRQMILQRLYPLLRRHTGVVDFWLDEIVFPVEAKCFPQKITSTAWDLCTPDHVTTGFSGTDDTRLLLPLSIQQINLPSLACTNGIVLRNLLQKAQRNASDGHTVSVDFGRIMSSALNQVWQGTKTRAPLLTADWPWCTQLPPCRTIMSTRHCGLKNIQMAKAS